MSTMTLYFGPLSMFGAKAHIAALMRFSLPLPEFIERAARGGA
jgi:hypothetical protein